MTDNNITTQSFDQTDLTERRTGYTLADRILAVVILLLPFIVLYWLTPFIGKHTIGNDYTRYWIDMQMFLRFSLRNGTWPLYAPGFDHGWTAAALTLGQLWHPISWIAGLMPGYWDGHAHEIGTLLRMLSLGLTHLPVYLLLRRLRLNKTWAFVISFITIYNLRMLDMFRYGASLESYTACILLCVVLVWHYLDFTKRLGPVCIIVLTWLCIVGGHSQIMFLAFLTAGFVCLVTPFYLAGLLPDEAGLNRRRLLRYYLSAALCVGVGILMSAVYILPIYFEYLSETYRSQGIRFDAVCYLQDNFGSAVYNFFNPFHSEVHGSFGGSSVILLAAVLPLLLVMKKRDGMGVFIIWLMGVVIFLLSVGSHTLLYYLFWRYFPFARGFRVPGRVGIAFPFIILLLLTWMAHAKPVQLRIAGRKINISPILLPAIVSLALFIIVNSLPAKLLNPVHFYYPLGLHAVPEIAKSFLFIAGVVTLAALSLYTMPHKIRDLAAMVFVLAVMAHTTVNLRYGTWVTNAPHKTLTLEQMLQDQQQQFGFRYNTGDRMRTEMLLHHELTYIDSRMARLWNNYSLAESRRQAYAIMRQERTEDDLVIENDDFLEQTYEVFVQPPEGPSNIELKHTTFNDLKFEVNAVEPAIFVFNFPFSKCWQAYVNGRDVPIYRANGIEQAILVPAGKMDVEFKYRSRSTVIGAMFSCLAMLVTSFWALTAIKQKPLRYALVTMLVCVCMIALSVWCQSFYNGRDIGTQYQWQAQPNSPQEPATD